MLNSEKLHSLFKGEKITFIYLCCNSSENSWVNIIKQNQIYGNHILLNSEQFEYFKTRFSINGFPRYILINKNGEIANQDAPMPGNDKIINDIKTLF